MTPGRTPSGRLPVAMVGLGDIARKAYLPALAARSDIELHLCTRNTTTLADVAAAYRVEHRHKNLDDLVAAGVEAAFVHVATAAHADVVAQLLHAGVHVYVDKPLADDLGNCVKLIELATTTRRSLMVGFNRRYAPPYRELPALSPQLVFLQKNRVGLPDSPRRVVFDDFIHVIDTLRFLVPDAGLAEVRATAGAGRLESVVVVLAGAHATAVGSMNRLGGHTQEILEVQAPGVRRVVHDIATIDDYVGDRHTVVRRGDWTPVHVQRGFAAICQRFLDAVVAGEVLNADDALRTHELCEQIIMEIEDARRKT
jgi:virulence factor